MIRSQSASFSGENDSRFSRIRSDLFSSCFTTIVPQVRLLGCLGVVKLVLLAYTYAAIGMPNFRIQWCGGHAFWPNRVRLGF